MAGGKTGSSLAAARVMVPDWLEPRNWLRSFVATHIFDERYQSWGLELQSGEEELHG